VLLFSSRTHTHTPLSPSPRACIDLVDFEQHHSKSHWASSMMLKLTVLLVFDSFGLSGVPFAHFLQAYTAKRVSLPRIATLIPIELPHYSAMELFVPRVPLSGASDSWSTWAGRSQDTGSLTPWSSP